jgi:hypothetical protein
MQVTRTLTMLAPADSGYPTYSVRPAGGAWTSATNSGVTRRGTTANYYVDLDLAPGPYSIEWAPTSDPLDAVAEDFAVGPVADSLGRVTLAAATHTGATIPTVTTVGTLTTNDDKTGYTAAVSDKTGFALADGSITSAKFATVTPGPSGFLERLSLLASRFFPVAGGSVTAPKSGNGNLVVKGTGGATIATQAVTDNGTTQTLGAAS